MVPCLFVNLAFLSTDANWYLQKKASIETMGYVKGVGDRLGGRHNTQHYDTQYNDSQNDDIQHIRLLA
jgi:hypothetical protein